MKNLLLSSILLLALSFTSCRDTKKSESVHDWDYSTNRGDLRSDTAAEPLFLAPAQPADEIMNDAKDAVQPTHASMPLTDEQILDLDEPFGAFARTVLAADRRIAFARAVLAAGDKP
jgi:hypothetical protein